MPNLSIIQQCKMCKHESNILLKTHDNHIFCFLCVIYDSMANKTNYVYDDYNIMSIANNYIWLYSSNYNGLWWCYNNQQNNQIENAFNDHLARHKILNPENDVETAIQIRINKSTKKINYPKSNTINFHVIDVESDDDNEVNFTEQVKKIDVEMNPIEKISYLINVNNAEYKLDFDLMKQINLSEIWKKRSIKRLILPITANKIIDIIDHLKLQNVIGMTGIKFK